MHSVNNKFTSQIFDDSSLQVTLDQEPELWSQVGGCHEFGTKFRILRIQDVLESLENFFGQFYRKRMNRVIRFCSVLLQNIQCTLKAWMSNLYTE